MKKLLFLFAGCLLFAGANAQGLEEYNEWFTDGVNASALETGGMDGYNVAIVEVPDGSSSSWDVQFCNIFTGNTGQEMYNSFEISLDVFFDASNNDVETSQIMLYTGKNYYYSDDETYDHGDNSLMFSNTELLDDENQMMQFLTREVTNGQWTTITLAGTIGESGEDYIGLQFNLGSYTMNNGDEDVFYNNEGTFYFRNINVKFDYVTQLSYYGVLELTSDDFEYENLGDNTLAITGFTNTEATSATIPSTVTQGGNEYTVTSIANEAFNNCTNLTEITIPNTIISIGSSAFKSCTSLSSVNIPASVMYIDNNPFEQCYGLTSITVDAANPYWSAADGVLFNKSKTVLKCCPAGKTGSYTVPSTVTELAYTAFSNCTQIEEVILPASLRTIRERAFWNCQNMESIIIPESVTWIAEDAFRSCDYTLTIYCEAAVEQDWNYNWNSGCDVNWAYGAWSLSEDGVLTVKKNIVFYSKSAYPWNSVRDDITSVVIENGVTTIGAEAFRDCYNLETVTLPNTITTIYEKAFNGCSSLTPNDNSLFSVTALYLGNEDNPFLCLIKSKNDDMIITVHSDCKVIANFAFSSSYVLTINVPETVEYIGEGAFSAVNTVYYTGSATGSPWGATVVNPVEDGDFVFADEEQTILVDYKGSDTEIEIPSTVVEIGSNVFSYTDITSVVFPDGLKKIGEEAFYYCKNLTSVELPESLIIIDDGAFAQCDALDEAEIPSSVVYIGDNAFENCALTSVTIPSSVEYIGNYAFSSCDNLETIDFSEATKLQTIGEYAFRWCDQLQTVDMTNATSLETIGTEAFTGCSSLEKVFIPASVGYVDRYAFRYCNDELTIFCESDWSVVNNDWDSYWSYDNYYEQTATVIAAYKNIYIYAYSNNSMYGTTTGTGYYEYGTETTITATANEGYTFIRWSDGETSSTRTITVMGWDYYEAIFADESYDIYTVALSVNNANYGSVYGAGNYVDGEYIEFYAEPAEGYHFVKWSDNNTNYYRYAFIDENIDLTAEFAINKYNVTFTAENGTIEGASDGTYDHGTELTLTAVPAEGYKFRNWTAYSLNSNNNPLSITITDDLDLSANFVETCVEVVEGVNSVYADNREQENCFFIPDETATYTFYTTTAYNPTYCYVLDADKNKLIEEEGGYYNGFRFNIELTEGETYYIGAGFIGTSNYINLGIRKAVTINLTAENGTVYGGGLYGYNSYVVIEAEPDEGYKFVRWSDGSTDSYRDFYATVDEDLEAIFVEEDQTLFYIDAWGTADGYYPGGGYVMGESYYTEGETVTLTAVPNTGNKFSQWRDGNTDNPRTITVTEDAEYVAEFEVIYYTINKVSENGYISGGGSYYWYGQTVGIEAIPNAYCTFTGWSDTEYTGSYRNIIITSDTTITAYFEPELFDVIAESANPAQGSVEGSGSYAYNSQVELKATGATGYHFLEWNDGNTDNPRTITVSDYEYYNTYTAYFEINTYTVSVDPQLENGTISGIINDGKYTHGSEGTFKAEAIGAYKFVRWSNLCTDEEITLTITSDMVLSAVFCESSKEIFTVETKANHGTVKGASNYFDGEKATFTASADEGYHFTYWNDDREATEPTLKKTITKDQTITAHFEINTYDVKIAAGEHGSVVAKKEGANFANGTVEHGEEIKLTALADAGYHFAGWSDGDKNAERTIKVTKELNLTANFEIDTYTLSVKATNGTIEGNGTFTVGTEVTLTAKPADGYHFVKWSDGNTSNPRIVTITADLFNTIDESFTAIFEVGEATAITEEEATADNVNIYAYGNTIVVENATSAIDVYSAMGQLVSRTIANGERNVITINGTGIYIVRTGNVAKRVMLQ